MSDMDINDIIGMSSEAGIESTLESEIDALSKIITDTKDGPHKLDENDEAFRLDSDDLSFTASFPCDSAVEGEKCDLLMKDILDDSEEIDKFISTSITDASQPDDSVQEIKECDKECSTLNKENTEFPVTSPKSASQDSAIEPLLNAESLNVNSSISLINEECISQESQSGSENQSLSGLEKLLEGSENKNEDVTISDEQDLIKIKDSVEKNNIKPISNLSTETREVIANPTDNLITDKSDIKDTGEILEQNENKQTFEDASKDQLDFAKPLVEKEEPIDESIFQKDLATPKETPMEVDLMDDNVVDNANSEQQEMLVEKTSNINTEIIDQTNEEVKTTNLVNVILSENEICEENVIINPINEIEQNVNRIESETPVEINISVPDIEDPLQIEQTNKNLSENIEIEEKEMSEIQLVECHGNNKGKTENDGALEPEVKIDNDSLESKIKTDNDSLESTVKQDNDLLESKFNMENKSLESKVNTENASELKDETSNTEQTNISHCKNSDNEQDNKILDSTDVIIEQNIKNLKETNTNFKISTDEETNDKTEIFDPNIKDLENAETSQDLSTTENNTLISTMDVAINETFKSTDADMNISKDIESLPVKEQSHNDITAMDDNQIVTDSIESSSVKIETENIKEENNTKSFDKKIEESIIEESEKVNESIKNEVNIIESTENDLVASEDKSIVRESAQDIETSPTLDNSKNLKLVPELNEPTTLEKTSIEETKEILEKSKIENEDKREVNVQEQIYQEKICSEITEETEDNVEINLSLDPDGNSSPISQNINEEQMETDPLDKVNVSQNIVNSKLLEESSELEGASNKIVETNSDNEENKNNEQVLDSQELSSNIFTEVEKDLESGFNELLETSENVNKETPHFADSETSNLPDRDFQSLDEKSQDSLSILDALQTEPMSTDHEKEHSKFESAEKEEDITLMFDEASQSPRHTASDKFVNDLYNSCVPDDTIDNTDIQIEGIEHCNEPLSIGEGEQNSERNRENQDSSNEAIDLEGNAQLDDQADAGNQLKDFLNSEDINVEASAEISELESAVKFLQESEEQDIQNSRSVENININQDNSSIFVAVEESLNDNASELVSDISEATLDPIAISEAEIISEAAKLENERKEKLQLEHQLKSSIQESSNVDSMDMSEKSCALPSNDNFLIGVEPSKSIDVLSAVTSIDPLKVPLIRQNKLTSNILPESSILDERYKEPPKIEIPEISPPLPSTPRASLLIQKDAKQRLESPDRLSASNEPKITDTPKKDSDKQQQQTLECENVGSPRIILKIAKSAIADCSEPRSPKSPKIRSAANSPNPDDSPGQKLGKIKLKLSKGGHPSIIPNNDEETAQWHTDSACLSSPLGMKIKLSKSGDASVVESVRSHEEIQKSEEGHKLETSIGMKIKLSKSGDASIVQHDSSPRENIEGKSKHKDAKEAGQETSSTKKLDSPSIGMKIKLSKSGDASIIPQDLEEMQECTRRTDSPIGMKIKLSKSGDASVVSNELPEDSLEKAEESLKRTDSPMGVRIKLTKTKSGNASIISNEAVEESESSRKVKEFEAMGDESAKAGIGMKIKLSKSGDASVIREDSPSRKSGEQPIGMKIKLSKTGDPSIIHTDTVKTKDQELKDISLKSLKKSHSDITIEPTKNQPTLDTAMMDLHSKRKEITISPIESKKAKADANLKQMLPDITIQPIVSPVKKDQQKLMLDPNAGSISRQQMNVINQEISITQVCSLSTGDTLMGDRLKNALNVQSDPSSSSPLNSDCEIIEPQPELIIVNENSNSSQDIMIIDEVPPAKCLVKTPKKRGRPRRNAVPPTVNVNMSSFQEQFEMQRDPLSLDHPTLPIFHQTMNEHMDIQQLPGVAPVAGEASERPRRTCRSQKSYAPPKRGRGRGRGKRKNEAIDIPVKKSRIDQDLTAIENATTAVISLEKLPIGTSPELFRALNQPTLGRVIDTLNPAEQTRDVELLKISDNVQTSSEFRGMLPHQAEVQVQLHKQLPKANVEGFSISNISSSSHLQTLSIGVPTAPTDNKDVDTIESPEQRRIMTSQLMEKSDTIIIKVTEEDDKQRGEVVVLNDQREMSGSSKDPTGQEYQNWLAPSIRKVSIESTSTRTESTISTLTVIDEETRMSAESGSRSQTPARNMSVPGTSETVLVNEESQGSTATTESEKVKVQKNRRMEINFDPDEGPFTVEKIAEYEWPPRNDETRPAATRVETFMIQEQISQYLGVKSFKRKYPDLKRRMVDMEERNFLRENGLVSESMCDMGLTAVSSSEVLDIMCSDFPEQYEEYRKHMREKAAKEHSKKQKELSAAANAERNRIDLAEMAMQSTLNWNVGLNKARRETRRCSLDLQTFTVHLPKRPVKFDANKRGSHYPVALIPGQYTDYYREYTPAELRYYPLNTVLYGPMRPNERKFDSQSEGSQSDSDSDSSSDDSSSSSSEGTQDTEGSQSTMDEVDMELAIQSDVKCKICLNNLNKSNRPEVLIQCGTCNGNVHPSCIDLTLDMVPHIRAYAWQCTDCKTCAQCHDPADEDKMLFCDMCDRGYHIYCVGLRRVPQGRWHCQECAVCANCGSKEPGGVNSDRNSVAQWQHEYKKADKNTRVYVSTFCVPCSKLRGNQGADN